VGFFGTDNGLGFVLADRVRAGFYLCQPCAYSDFFVPEAEMMGWGEDIYE
jgi:hypothetical protein